MEQPLYSLDPIDWLVWADYCGDVLNDPAQEKRARRIVEALHSGRNKLCLVFCRQPRIPRVHWNITWYLSGLHHKERSTQWLASYLTYEWCSPSEMVARNVDIPESHYATIAPQVDYEAFVKGNRLDLVDRFFDKLAEIAW